MFLVENPDDVEEGQDFTDNLNPDSFNVLETCFVEPALANTIPGERYQFERQGYFCVDPDSTDEKRVFNLTVALRDTWARIQQQRQNS